MVSANDNGDTFCIQRHFRERIRRRGSSRSRGGALDSRRRNISVRQRSLGFSFLFCKQSTSQSRGVAYWREECGGRGSRAVGETAAMYVWQQQAINQLTVRKNCRKLLDIYGQRTQSPGGGGEQEREDEGRALSFDRSRPLSNTRECNKFCLPSMTLKDSRHCWP